MRRLFKVKASGGAGYPRIVARQSPTHRLRSEPMRENLERIRVWLEREAPHLASSLQTGLSRADMQQIMGKKAAQYCIPEEVAELYAWRNGQSEYVPFFDVLRFQPFEDAVEYANLVEEYSDGEFPLMVFQELNYDAGYRFKCESKEQSKVPAFRWIHGDEQIETTSLYDLLSAVAEAFESGVFRLNDQRELDKDDDLWNAIVVRHHPDRIRAVNVVLNRQWPELSGKEVRNAFYDLWRMHHSETAALVREYLQDCAERGVQDLETHHAVLGTGIGIQDEWSRGYALSLIFSSNFSAQREALTLLAWRW